MICNAQRFPAAVTSQTCGEPVAVFRIEERNDRTLILMTVGFGAGGAFYGVEISSSALGALIAGLFHGFLVYGFLVAFLE
jgi:hypothetical protein